MITTACGHTYHYGCVAAHMPMACPQCRAMISLGESVIQGEDSNVDEAIEDMMNIDEGMTAEPTTAQIPRPEICPVDVLPLCCPHLRGGPGGGGVDVDMRSMRYHAQRLPNGEYVDTWLCYGCGFDMSRHEISHLLTCERTRCLSSHGWQAVVVDMKISPPAVVGRSCVVALDTHLQPIPCDEPYVRYDMFTYDGAAAITIDSGDDDDDDPMVDEFNQLRDMVQQHRDEDFAELERLVSGWGE